MLRVGLTGGLGSGKSTVAAMLAGLGAHVIEADSVGRTLMQPGQPVYDAIVTHFGSGVVAADGTLDRRALARIAFQDGRSRELSLLVHPAVIAAQEAWLLDLQKRQPDAIAVIESALIFEAERDGTVPGWRHRFDTLVLVTAPVEIRIDRFLARAGILEQDARYPAMRADALARISTQISDAEKVPLCDFVIENSASLRDTSFAVQALWKQLSAKAKTIAPEREVV